MNTQRRFRLTRMSATVRSALILSALFPAVGWADDASDLTTNKSTIELGAGWINNGNDSSKFGEYNGMDVQNGYGIANFDLQSGGKFDSTDADRLNIEGRDLGLDSRKLNLDFRRQGTFEFNLSHDELTRNFDNSYQTPFVSPGSNILLLPQNWAVPGLGTATLTNGLVTKGASTLGLTVPNGKTALTSALTTAQQQADLAAFQPFQIRTIRKTDGGGFSAELSRSWQLTGSVSQTNQTGSKALGDVSGLGAGEISDIMPYPINQTTNQYNLGLNFTGEQSFLHMAYYGSDFIDHIPSVYWQSWSVAPTQTTPGLTWMSTAPSNQFQQFQLTGGYTFAPKTRLIAEAAYARNTQNDAFLTNTEAFTNYSGINTLPTGSLHGLVTTTDLDLKLLTEPVDNLRITVDGKLKNRDNRTPINSYQWTDAGAGASGTLGTATTFGNFENNVPFSKDLNEFSFDANYHLSDSQSIGMGFVTQGIHRWCENSWIDCADTDQSRQNTIKVNYHFSLSDSLSGQVDGSYSKLHDNAYNPISFASLLPGTQPYLSQLLANAGYGQAIMPVSNAANVLYNTGAGLPCATSKDANGNTIFSNCSVLGKGAYASENVLSEMPGLQRYYVSNSNIGNLRFMMNWQATDMLSFDTEVSYNDTDYPNDNFGLQQVKDTSYNLSATLAPNPDLTMNAYLNIEQMNSRQEGWGYNNGTPAAYAGTSTTQPYSGCPASFASSDAYSWANASSKIDPCTQYSSRVGNKDYVVGLSVLKKNLLIEKVDVKLDASYINSTVANGFSGYVLQAASAAGGLPNGGYLPLQNLPNITSNTLQVMLDVRYHIDSASLVKAGYIWARMQTNDYYYSGLQLGGLGGVLPTYQQPYAYVVQAMALSYQRTF